MWNSQGMEGNWYESPGDLGGVHLIVQHAMHEAPLLAPVVAGRGHQFGLLGWRNQLKPRVPLGEPRRQREAALALGLVLLRSAREHTRPSAFFEGSLQFQHFGRVVIFGQDAR